MSDASLAQKVRDKQQQLSPDALQMAAADGQPKDRLDGVAPRARDTMDEQFPTAALSQKEKMDRVQEAKLQLQTPDQVGYTPFGKLVARDEDFEWYQRKQQAVEAANFQKWFAANFDHMSPADKKRAKELYPEFYAQRKKLLKQQTKNLQRLASIKLNGVQSKDDLITQYLAETGRLDIGPLEHLLNPEQAGAEFGGARRTDAQARFKRGLLSPFRVFGEEALPRSGETGLGERREQAKDFAKREYSASELELGFNQHGFPPASGNYPSDVQDKQWFELLQSQ